MIIQITALEVQSGDVIIEERPTRDHPRWPVHGVYEPTVIPADDKRSRTRGQTEITLVLEMASGGLREISFLATDVLTVERT